MSQPNESDSNTLQLILTSKIHLESLLDSIADPILVVSPNKTVQRLNAPAAKFMGSHYRDALGSECFRIFHKRTEPCKGCPLAKAVTHAEKGNLRLEVPTQEGIRIFDLRFFPLYDKQGSVVSMVEHYVDITEGEMAKSALELEHTRILSELKTARNIQEALLPPVLPKIHGVRLLAYYEPMEEVGGDLYDFINIDKEHIGFLIADVSGHGVPASLMGAMAKMSFYNHTPGNLSTLNVFERVNRDLFHNLMMEYYISGAYLLFNTVENTLRYSRAGHPEPLLRRASTGLVEKLHTPGYFLGIMSNGDYKEKETKVNKGDRLLLYTDGVIEAVNSNNVKFGMERLIAWLEQNGTLPIEEMKEKLIATIKAYTGEQKYSDDLTFLLIEFTENGCAERFHLSEQFQKEEVPRVFRAVHPLDFTDGISRIIDDMKKGWYPLSDQDAVKYAVFEALELFHYTAPEESDGVYLAWFCDSEKTSVLITDSRFNDPKPHISLEATHSAQLSTLKERVTTLLFPNEGRKIFFTRRNSKY